MSYCSKRFSWYFMVVLLLVWYVFLPSFYADTIQDTSSVSGSGKVVERPKQNLVKEIGKNGKDTEGTPSVKEHAPPDESPQTISTPAITPSVDDLLEAETISKEIITGVISETAKRMENIPADVKDDSPEGKIRSALKRQNEILKELLTTVESREKILSQRKSLTLRKEELEVKTREYEALGPVHLPAELKREKQEILQTKLDLNRNTLSQLKEEANIFAKRIEKLPELQGRYAEQETSLETAIERISTELSVAIEGTDKEFLMIELENAKLENRVVKESLQLLDNELRLEKEFPHLRSELIDYQQRMVTRSEEEYDVYQKAMSSLLAKEKEVLKADLEEKKEATEFAKTHSERFLADWEEKIARISAFKIDLEVKKGALSNMVIQLCRSSQRTIFF